MNNPKISNEISNQVDLNRATGRTTRLIDQYIQILFTTPNKEIEIIDHHGTQKDNEFLARKVLSRLYAEHKGCNFEIVKQNVLKYVR